MIKQNDNKVKKYINAFKKKSLMVEQYFEAIIASPPKGEAAKKAVQNAFYECCKKLCFAMDNLLCLCDYTNDNEIVDDREKIIKTLRASGYGYFITHKKANADEALADAADALVADGYGDVAEWKRRAEVAEKEREEYRRSNRILLRGIEEKILIVEDGSIDVEELQQFIEAQNLKIHILVYRQGSAAPVFLDKQLKRNMF